MPAIGRELRFLLDASLLPTPVLTDDPAYAVQEYLLLVSCNGAFAADIIKLLLEDRRTAFREWENEGKRPIAHAIGNIIQVNILITSSADSGTIGKLSYNWQGVYRIIKDLGHGSYMVQKLNRPDLVPQKMKMSDIKHLPSSLLPCEPLDKVDLRYLNHSHSPVVHPAQRFL